MRRVVLASNGYVWVRWQVDNGHSSWHQLALDQLTLARELRTADLVSALRLRTRCGFVIPQSQALETWQGPLVAPEGQTCVSCTNRFLLGVLPPLGTPPVPETGHVRPVLGRRPKGRAHAPGAPAD